MFRLNRTFDEQVPVNSVPSASLMQAVVPVPADVAASRNHGSPADRETGRTSCRTASSTGRRMAPASPWFRARPKSVAAAIVLGGPFTLAAVLLGLTILPANALLAALALLVVLYHLWRHPGDTWRALWSDATCHVAYAAFLAMLIALALTTDVGQMKFWGYDFNVATLPPNIVVDATSANSVGKLCP